MLVAVALWKNVVGLIEERRVIKEKSRRVEENSVETQDGKAGEVAAPRNG